MSSLGDRLYRVLLLAFPLRLRLAHGDDMLELFQQLRASEAGHPLAIMRLWMRAIRDVVLEGVSARFGPSPVSAGAPLPPEPSAGRDWQRPVGDIRLAVRSLLRAPLPTLVAILALGLGIGSNTAIFSTVYQVLVNPLPYPGIERVVFPWRQRDSQQNMMLSPSLTDVEKLRQASSIESIVLRSTTRFTLHDGELTDLVQGSRVDPGLLDFTGTRVDLGRPFTQADAESKVAAQVALLSHSLWKRRFNGDPEIVGRTIELNDTRHTVIGVLPESFRLPFADVELLVPLVLTPSTTPPGRSMAINAMVRLKPGVDRAVAQGELSTLIDDGTPDPYRVVLNDATDLAGTSLQSALWVLMAAVSCVLLIACANVTHLLMARNVGRQQELAVRTSLGASPTRLFQQLMTEHLVLSLAGGALGAVVAWLAIDGLASWRPDDLQPLAHVTADTLTYVYSLGLSIAAGTLVGTLPAWSAVRSASAEGNAFGTRTTSDRRTRWVRRGLSVAEIAVALVLLCGAGLLIRSYQHLANADLGVDPEGVVKVSVDLPSSRYSTPAVKQAFYDSLTESLRTLPGVTHTAVALLVPPAGGMFFSELIVDGVDDPQNVQFDGGNVQPGFIEALGIPLRRGRTFTNDDVDSDQPVVLVSEDTAARLWPGVDPLGKRLRLSATDNWSTVVGVVGNVGGTERSAKWLQIYMPFDSGLYINTPPLVVRTSGSTSALMEGIRSQISTLDSRLAVRSMETLDEVIDHLNVRPRFNAILLALLASIGLVLAVTGVYGVISYSVGLRTREFGVRVALGAAPFMLGRNVLAEAAVVASAGVALGLALWMLAGRGLASLLVGLESTDALTLALVSTLIFGATLLAAWMPARRAVRVDPVEALRADV